MDKPPPEAFQPQITGWGHVWRIMLMVAISAIAWGTVAARQLQDHPALFWLDIALAVPAYVLVFFRRRWPMPVAVVLALLSSLSGLAAGPATLAAASVATRRHWRQVALVGVVSLVCAQVFAAVEPTGNPQDPYLLVLVINLTFLASVLGWGMYVGSRRELVWTLRQRAERAEAEQELRVARARSNERARIAREMHDVLAHRISQISMHAGALAFRDDLTAEEMRSSVQVIQEKAHEALTDLRGVLGVLRDEAGEPLDAPQPTYDDLPRLVDDARGSGLDLEYVDLLDGGSDHVPDAVGRTLYRIVQEGITNARKHAPGARLSIRVSGSPGDGIDILLRNPVGFGPTATPGSGLGLVGLAERAQLRGGRIETSRDGSTFVLHGWIPWAA
ncbi:sensor histidine kinase [Nocardioides sp.]|uniref:sensor histidine kinase n=1 Tax=Nocardioides sp. TaxID=35761 RepID=UPI002D80BF96|nr:histidine kinase [Nocardioides sp.]HET8961431.1 histidine kinase [Nocardioides sp.]